MIEPNTLSGSRGQSQYVALLRTLTANYGGVVFMVVVEEVEEDEEEEQLVDAPWRAEMDTWSLRHSCGR